MNHIPYKYLNLVNSPDDLKKLSLDEVGEYCKELRQFIIEQLAANPGHLGSNLGVVELTTMLHYVYDTPHDKLVWDVGHQAYAHKIITGRRDVFATNRKLGGISGFPRMDESVYDAFGGGHASVSISAALGMAKAAELLGEKRKVVAILGDGALTGGLAFEGLNNAGVTDNDILVILNDNHMSIDPNVGAMNEYLIRLTTSKRYNAIKNKTWDLLSPVPKLRRMVQKAGNSIKRGWLQQSNLFEGLNFRYFGPIDGHDIKMLHLVLRGLKDIPGPKVLHVLTVKGKGYKPAEEQQSIWHAPGCFDPDSGERIMMCGDVTPVRYQDVFGHTMVELAKLNDKIVGITAAMPSGSSLNVMMKVMPERTFDVGIAEGHAVTFSAGLVAAGLLPFCVIYSSFMQRAYDNIIHDVALQRLPVVFCLDRAGLVGEDGPTHHGVFDIAFLLPIPNLIISSPLNEADLRNLMYTAQMSGRPFVIRYPRGRGEGVDWHGALTELPVGKSQVLRDGDDLALLSFGPVGNDAARAAERAAAGGVSVFHADLRYAKPLDEELLHDVGKRFKRVITVEDGVVEGGVGMAVARFMMEHGYDCRVESIGIGDNFVTQGSMKELHALCGLDEAGIYGRIMRLAD